MRGCSIGSNKATGFLGPMIFDLLNIGQRMNVSVLKNLLTPSIFNGV